MGWEQTKIAGSGALRGIIEVDTHPNAFFPYNHSHPSYTPSLPQVERALEMLTLQAVKPDAEAPGQMTGQTEFTMNDGLAIRITLFHADKDVWARFVASGPDAVKAEVNRLNGRLAGWCYQIASWKEKSLMPTIDDLKAEEKPAAEAK